ncbi:hypothetical protein IWW36_001721 [Coemansia brasiliensis]|uniref:WD40 repeat-like protein n=1 Tax=Coemansia brasiliensis TaxID=2650707 RepID=A0A9W8I977_9FUNG|nr:hypothetical protein IWW36_001721 [Coemansia brasiliensis]
MASQTRTSSSSPSGSNSKTPTVELPGAFRTHPQKSKRQISVSQIMRGGVAETVSGGLANVVGGMYNIVNYVNPLGTADKQRSSGSPQETSDSGHSSGARLDSIDLQPPSAGTSVAADVDEHSLADANADNPENNRPPTPTKPSLTRMLRFPTPDPALHSSSAEYQQAAHNDPIARNVSQRTGRRFRPGSEEKRRYVRRISKAPQLDAPPIARRSRSHSSVSETRLSAHDSNSSSGSSSDNDDENNAADGPCEAELAQFYHAAANTQRTDAKQRAVEPWRFITPRVKRVKRRVLWRLFLAQELTPAVYDEATSNAPSPPASSAPRPPPTPTSEMPASALPGAHKHAIWTMEFSVCGKYLAAGGQDGVVRVWRIAPFAREQVERRVRSESPMSAASVPSPASPAHARQKSVREDIMPFANTAPIAKGKHLRSFSVGQPALHASARCPRPPMPAAAVAADHGVLTSPTQAPPSASTQGSAIPADLPSAPTAQLHPMHAYELLEPVPFRSYVGHSADVLALSWSKNGFLLSASTDRTVRLWHPHRPECLCTFRHRDIVTSVAFNPRDDRLFISGSLDCRLRLWDIPARRVRHWTRLPEGQMVTSVAFTSSRGDRIVAGTYRGMCVFYSTDGLAVLGRMHARSSRGRNSKGSKITGFAYAPTGQVPPALLSRLLGPAHYESLLANPRLLVSSNDSRLRMFLPAKRDLDRKYKGHANASSQAYARFSSDGRYIVSGSEDHNVYVWPVAQDNAATVATHPNSDHIRRVGHATSGAVSSSSDRPRSVRSEKQPLLASLFSRRRHHYEQKEEEVKNSNSPAAPEEWESLDGKVEEKSIYEYFPAHDAAVSQALFVPAATLQYLADHDDPILSRLKIRHTKSNGDVENTLSPNANATFGAGIQVPPPADDSDELKNVVEDMTAIIVSADTQGCIRVFRKDINVQRLHAQPNRNQSHTSLIKAKESVNSLTRVLTGDNKNPLPEINDLDTYKMAPDHSIEQAQPTPLSSHQHPSFWNRLGRRMSQKRQNSTFSGTPSTDSADRQSVRSRAASSGNNNSQRQQRKSLAAIVESSSGSINKQSQVCAHCGNDQFIDFAVAPTASKDTGASADTQQQMHISVCQKCKHVKDMPTH